MSKTTRLRVADIRGAGRLAADGVVGLADVVEAMHTAIIRTPLLRGRRTGPARGITGLVYRSVRGVARLAGGSIDAALAPLAGLLDGAESSPGREAALAALNGVVGDHLEASGNPLAIPMRLRQDGREVAAAAIARPGPKILVLVHGLCMNDLQWRRKGHDHGARLAADLGYTPLYLHYNTGRHISRNGRDFAELLDGLLRAWPVPVTELAIVAHSMGGLVSRSACHYGAAAGHAWPDRLRRLVFLGTPHHGAALERGGNLFQAALGLTPYTAALGRVPRLRSAGITDLRYGSMLDDDWAGRDRFARSRDPRRALPLPAGVACYAAAATTGGRGARLIGDGLVPLSSALGRHADPALDLGLPAERQWIGADMNHFDLLDRQEAYLQIKHWLADEAATGQ